VIGRRDRVDDTRRTHRRPGLQPTPDSLTQSAETRSQMYDPEQPSEGRQQTRLARPPKTTHTDSWLLTTDRISSESTTAKVNTITIFEVKFDQPVPSQSSFVHLY